MRSPKSLKPMMWGASLLGMLFAALPQYAAADLFQCQSKDGTVRVYDRERNACGRLSADNPDWTKIGNPPWNDRIDDYGNDDWTRGRSMCLFKHVGYNTLLVRIPPGYAWSDIPNSVSSNQWSC